MYQHGVLSGATFFALHQLLAAEWDILLELRQKFRRCRLFRADSGRKPLGIPFRLLLIGPWLCVSHSKRSRGRAFRPARERSLGINVGHTWLRLRVSRKQNAETRKPKAESRKQKAENRKQGAENRKQKAESRKQKAESRKQKAESRKQSRKPRATLRQHYGDILGNTMVTTGKFSDAQDKLIGEVQEPLCASNVWEKHPVSRMNLQTSVTLSTCSTTRQESPHIVTKNKCCSDPAFTSTMTPMDSYCTRFPETQQLRSCLERGGNHNMASSTLLDLSSTCLEWNLCRTVICRLTCTFKED